MDLESWFVEIMETLKKVRQDNINSDSYSFSLFFNKEEIEAITDAYEKTDWIEIY